MESLRRPAEDTGVGQGTGLSRGPVARWEPGRLGGGRGGRRVGRASAGWRTGSPRVPEDSAPLSSAAPGTAAVRPPRPPRLGRWEPEACPLPGARAVLPGAAPRGARGVVGEAGAGRRASPPHELTGCGGHSPREPGNLKPCLGALQPLREELPRGGMSEGCGIFGRIPRALWGLTRRFSVIFKFSEVISCLTRQH